MGIFIFPEFFWQDIRGFISIVLFGLPADI
nr:MAG TPA: 2-vinyl bacteriochlorophyllide hydratase [Caudoviricetes sp.]